MCRVLWNASFASSFNAVYCAVAYIAISVAVGATPRRVMQGVFRRGLVLIISGTAIGFFGAAVTARLLRKFLFGVDPLSLSVLGSVALIITVVAAVAITIPAWRAARIDPVLALRSE